MAEVSWIQSDTLIQFRSLLEPLRQFPWPGIRAAPCWLLHPWQLSQHPKQVSFSGCSRESHPHEPCLSGT